MRVSRTRIDLLEITKVHGRYCQNFTVVGRPEVGRRAPGLAPEKEPEFRNKAGDRPVSGADLETRQARPGGEFLSLETLLYGSEM